MGKQQLYNQVQYIRVQCCTYGYMHAYYATVGFSELALYSTIRIFLMAPRHSYYIIIMQQPF